jgi:hypothetical protein
MRTLLKRVERDALFDMGITFSWASAKLDLSGRHMTYSIFEKMRRLARREEAVFWYELSI